VTKANLTIVDIVRELYYPFVPSMIDDVFETSGGLEFTQRGKKRLTEPLKNKVCILDADSRDLHDTAGSLLNEDSLAWEFVRDQKTKLGVKTAGLVNHYLYGMLNLTVE
jgi:hypothetical protein